MLSYFFPLILIFPELKNIEYLQKLHDKYESVYNNGTSVVDGIEIHVIDATGSPQSVLDQITVLLEGGVVV